MIRPFFRAGVGACITDGRGRVLAFRRRGVPEAAWQMPQGGIKPNETPELAVFREVHEEAGIAGSDLKRLDEHPEWLVYELPPESRNPKVGWGQAQRWFLLRVQPGVTVRPDRRELDAWEWLSPETLLVRAVEFRRRLYQEVLGHFELLKRRTVGRHDNP